MCYIFRLTDVIRVYNVDKSVLLEKTPLLKFITNYIRDPSGAVGSSFLGQKNLLCLFFFHFHPDVWMYAARCPTPNKEIILIVVRPPRL